MHYHHDPRLRASSSYAPPKPHVVASHRNSCSCLPTRSNECVFLATSHLRRNIQPHKRPYTESKLVYLASPHPHHASLPPPVTAKNSPQPTRKRPNQSKPTDHTTPAQRAVCFTFASKASRGYLVASYTFREQQANMAQKSKTDNPSHAGEGIIFSNRIA